MSLRLRLALAFLLLSALPLGAFVAYSYLSSRAALRTAMQSEAEATARELEQRVAGAAADLSRRLRALSAVPIESWVARSPSGDDLLAPQLADLDQALPYLDGIRFVAESPEPPAAPTAPAAAPPPAAAAVAPTPPAPPVPSGESPPDGLLPTEFFAEIAQIQREALQAAASATRDRGGRLDAKAQEEMKQRLEERARELEKAFGEHARAATERAAALAARAQDRAATNGRRAARALVPVGVPTPVARATPAPSPPPSLAYEVSDGARVVGELRAQINGNQLVQSVLSRVDRKKGEIPFALGADRTVYAANRDDAQRLESIPAFAARSLGSRAARDSDDWIVVSRHDPSTGFQLGIARPLSGAIADLRRAAASTFALGLGLLGIATAGFFPLTSRLIRSVRELDSGAARIADGDLATRVAVRGNDEIARLGRSFNRMAEQLVENQAQLLVEERRRKEEEISRRLLAAENERRGRELEEARQFQLSLLPRELPALPGYDLAVEMTTATEVGGDYYDFQSGAGGDLVLAIGDATGHGAAAGTLVTAVKSLFAAGATTHSPCAFLVSANAAIHRMGLVRRAMALAIARVSGARVVLSAAGMPPVLHFRAAHGAVEELVLPGTPLGSLAEFPYLEVALELEPGDALLFVSDGLPELPDEGGEPFGYERLRTRFGQLAADLEPGGARASAAAIVAGLRAAASAWGGERPPVDDVTLLAVRRR